MAPAGWTASFGPPGHTRAAMITSADSQRPSRSRARSAAPTRPITEARLRRTTLLQHDRLGPPEPGSRRPRRSGLAPGGVPAPPRVFRRPAADTTFGLARTVRSRTVRAGRPTPPAIRWQIPASRGRPGALPAIACRPSRSFVPFVLFVLFVRFGDPVGDPPGGEGRPGGPEWKHSLATFPAWPCDQAIAGVGESPSTKLSAGPADWTSLPIPGPSGQPVAPNGRGRPGHGAIGQTRGSAPRPGGGCAGAAHQT
ncbi:hypothetical protein FF36_01524 [Frankia torreyi]|uniref:Uncharacterized protein n=1 Tax=Frankia torreyi TaxID=1856 RepID=A0A0D8BIZ7_9ACTN|nr:hypothetical protein FF36_01524 [Frankia torreyi]KQM06038.1 hypothetical protein FF86_101163 [Frankia sp. CpI1-P]